MSYTKEQIIKQLKDAECVVTFSKVNGERREMPCTLQEDQLPQSKENETTMQKRVRKVNPEVINVWCTDKQDWRSFRVENVIDIRPIS